MFCQNVFDVHVSECVYVLVYSDEKCFRHEACECKKVCLCMKHNDWIRE